MTALKIYVDCDEEQCGNCDYRDNGDCSLFGGTTINNERCSDCLMAEDAED